MQFIIILTSDSLVLAHSSVKNVWNNTFSMTSHSTSPYIFALHTWCSGPLDTRVIKVWRCWFSSLCPPPTMPAVSVGVWCFYFCSYYSRTRLHCCYISCTETCLLPHSCTFYPLSWGNHSIFSHTLFHLQTGGGTQQINNCLCGSASQSIKIMYRISAQMVLERIFQKRGT